MGLPIPPRQGRILDKNESSNDEREEKRANDEREQPEEREYQQCWSQFVTKSNLIKFNSEYLTSQLRELDEIFGGR